MEESHPATVMPVPPSDATAHTASLDPLISIVTVVRNGERHLAETINSVTEQTYKKIEFIIIDGNSTDRTVDIILQHAERITAWISEPDGGIYDAMNKAVEMCRGDYLYFLNCADRFVHPRTVEEVVKVINSEAPDIVCGHVQEIHDTGTRVYRYHIDSQYQLYLQTICHQALFTAREIFHTVGGFDTRYRISADRDWLLRALKVYHYKLSYIDLPISVFDISGVSSRNRMQLKMENFQMNRKYFKWQFYPFLFRQALAKVGRIMASSC